MRIGQVLLGFALGTVATATAFHLLSPTAPSPGAASPSATPAACVPQDVVKASSPAVALAPLPAAAASPGLAPSSATVPRPPVDCAKQVLTAPAPAPSGAHIALSGEHAKVLLPPPDERPPLTMPQLHQQVLSEPRDDNWANALESNIRAFLASHNGGGEFEIMSVVCRQTLCEVLAFGNLPTSGKRWNEIWEKARDQPWHDRISGESTTISVRNQRYVIVTMMHRAKQP